MKTVFPKILGIGAIASAFLLGGCADISGGGWMYSAGMELPVQQQFEVTDEIALEELELRETVEKATFGFKYKCTQIDEGTSAYRGHLTYHDHGSTFINAKGREMKIAFNAVTEGEGVSCVDREAFYFPYIGEYTIIPANAGEGGMAKFWALYSGETGPDKEDLLFIMLFGGDLDGYVNVGVPEGGNIKVK